MATCTIRPLTTDEQDRPPLDTETMRVTARRLLAGDVEPPTPEELEMVTLQLHGHIEVAIPDVEAAAERFPEDDVPRACALACVDEARRRLGAEPGHTLSAGIAHARRLARSVNALCDHHERLAKLTPGSGGTRRDAQGIYGPALRPWGLARMEPYPTVHAAATAVALDPASQTAVFHDLRGCPVELGKHGTGSGTETRTQTSQGDGSGPANSDEGHDQDSDQD
ncbi:DUF6415 family natural product biosynthesis protein [Streptomyces ipomoeae]|jgi:putative ATP-grasp target RiPP|uniref:Uncharacterized protein n=2 Tax=Streptomyces ipomoeae TaxID=103232 RepID=L1L104_9ACTN|nr:DUF6415 family natural product biosynthesis protein [Streptomyces ipomoeae]EKX66592.1 hypothetical protein STRIP9103_04080 [Streptomyces ipomoeae 91-03]MDX2697187.1 DUF6415 family natural product biosynthesis protein [Streptomyces ipomoeae]MDX2824744.1 DUF6415 family natural product biosynthesis protein [Streptomyces ipomoeae]MDX2843035.1 DUF6415 family natural product biosynthesis protein [Streptomyces ipomoeae]MDX2877393.1 DUF6415 family natural product biosynthesis protein [Streptomyces 